MKKIILTLILLALPLACLAQDTIKTQPLTLTINQISGYVLDENITFWLTLKNLTSEVIPGIPELIWSSRIIWDGKEYNRTHGEDWSSPPWSGPAEIPPNAEIGFALGLSDYAVPKEILTVGKHNMTVKIKATTSNTIQIEVKGKKQRVELQPIKSKLIPQKGRVYHIITPPQLHETHEPGPSELNTHIAWRLANEFVFRTELREYYVLPSQSVQSQKANGEYTVFFSPKKGDDQLIIRVDINKNEATVINAKVKEQLR